MLRITPVRAIRSSATLLIISVALSFIGLIVSMTPVAASNCLPPGSSCSSSGTTGTSSLSAYQSGSLSYDNTYAYSSTPAPSGTGNPGTTSCSGTGYENFALKVVSTNNTYLSGVNSQSGTGFGFTGDSPGNTNGGYTYSSTAYYGHLMPSSITPTQNNYVSWVGTWTPITQQVTTSNYGWVNTNNITETYTTATSTVKDVYDTTVDGIELWWIYNWEYIGTTTSTVVVGCQLEGLSVAGFGTTPYCATCYIPPGSSFSAGAITLANKLEASWSAGSVTSSPPAGSITVWVPTVFSLTGDPNSLPPIGGYPPSSKVNTSKVVAKLKYQRSLTMTLIVQAVPEAVQWTYTAQGGQSGGAGFTCTLTTPPYQSTSASSAQQCNPTNDPNAGEFNPSGNGYIFTHDASHLTVNAKVIIDVSAIAQWTINGNTSSEVVPLNGGASVVKITLKAKPEYSTIQQVEGVTQPPPA